jgi:hypothetical protein
MVKNTHRSSPDHFSKTIGPGVSPGPIVLYDSVSEKTGREACVRRSVIQIVCFALFPLPEERTVAAMRPSGDTIG